MTTSPSCPSTNPLSAAPAASTWDVFLDSCHRAYPTVSVVNPDVSAFHSRIRWCTIDNFPIAQVRTANIIVDACAHAATQQGLSDRYKLIWQIGGSAFFESRDRHTEILAGQVMIVPFSSSYRLHTREHYNALTLVFGADQVPRWRSLAAKLCGRPLMIGAAFNATAAGIGSLLRTRGAAVSASLVVEYVVDLVFRLLLEQVEGAPLSPPRGGARLERVRALVEKHLDEHDYSPTHIALALGMSRRSLYEAFRYYGITPADFIKQIRLEHARRDVLRNGGDAPSLTEVALRNGFNDSASFSRAFRIAFGVAPSVLRAAH